MALSLQYHAVFHISILKGVDKMPNMYAHGMAGTGLIPFKEKFKDQLIVSHGDLLHIGAVMGYLHYLVHSAVYDGIKAAHIFVMGGLNYGIVKLLVCLRPVPSLPGNSLHALGLSSDMLKFLIACSLTGQSNGGRFKNKPHFKQILGSDAGAHI